MKRLCVYCGSSPGTDPRFGEAAKALAREMVSRGIDLVYGGGNAGLMGIVAREVLSWAQMGLHRKPVGLLNTAEFYAPFVSFFDHLVESGFVSSQSRRLLIVCSEAKSLLKAMDQTSPSS